MWTKVVFSISGVVSTTAVEEFSIKVDLAWLGVSLKVEEIIFMLVTTGVDIVVPTEIEVKSVEVNLVRVDGAVSSKDVVKVWNFVDSIFCVIVSMDAEDFSVCAMVKAEYALVETPVEVKLIKGVMNIFVDVSWIKISVDDLAVARMSTELVATVSDLDEVIMFNEDGLLVNSMIDVVETTERDVEYFVVLTLVVDPRSFSTWTILISSK